MDLKQFVANRVQRSFEILQCDLENLPEEAFSKCFGGKARTVADLVHELNLVNDHIGLTLRGEPLFDWPEGWITAPEDQRTKESVLSAFQASSAKFKDMVNNFTAQQLEETVVSDGKETTRFNQCLFVSMHNWYHSGQFNFIQTLLGDDGWHWS